MQVLGRSPSTTAKAAAQALVAAYAPSLLHVLALCLDLAERPCGAPSGSGGGGYDGAPQAAAGGTNVGAGWHGLPNNAEAASTVALQFVQAALCLAAVMADASVQGLARTVGPRDLLCLEDALYPLAAGTHVGITAAAGSWMPQAAQRQLQASCRAALRQLEPLFSHCFGLLCRKGAAAPPLGCPASMAAEVRHRVPGTACAPQMQSFAWAANCLTSQPLDPAARPAPKVKCSAALTPACRLVQHSSSRRKPSSLVPHPPHPPSVLRQLVPQRGSTLSRPRLWRAPQRQCSLLPWQTTLPASLLATKSSPAPRPLRSRRCSL